MWIVKPFMQKDQAGLEGRTIDIGNVKVHVRNAIVEGGFSCVYLARDAVNLSKQYALKHMICPDGESLGLVMKEIKVLEMLKGHPNVVTLVAHAVFDTGRTKEAILVMEFCEKSLVTVMENRGVGYFDEKQILVIFRDICNAVFAMHCQSPPIAHRSVGYCTYYGKKLDPEPERCRRSDGKKWRCSKDAHPDSKYCERHMHRNRIRSRKPVESRSLSQSQSSSSLTVTSVDPAGSGSGGSRSRNIAGSFQNIPSPQHSVAGGSSMQDSSFGTASTSELQMALGSYGIGNREYRSSYGVKPTVDKHSFFSEASGNARALGMNFSLDRPCPQMPSSVTSTPLSKARNSSVLQSTYPQLHSVQDLEQAAISSLSQPQHQYSFFECGFGPSEPVKLENQCLRPFFDEWPRTKDAWSELEDERSDRSFSTTQLSISIPMASSDFSPTTSRSHSEE